MKILGLLKECSAVTERQFFDSKGEQRTVAELTAIVSDGIDTVAVELVNDAARNFAQCVAQGSIKAGDGVVVDYQLAVTRSEKGTFLHARGRKITKM